MIRLSWRVRETGVEGFGEAFQVGQRSLLEAWAKKMNEDHPDITHWIEVLAPSPAGSMEDGTK